MLIKDFFVSWYFNFFMGNIYQRLEVKNYHSEHEAFIRESLKLDRTQPFASIYIY